MGRRGRAGNGAYRQTDWGTMRSTLENEERIHDRGKCNRTGL